MRNLLATILLITFALSSCAPMSSSSELRKTDDAANDHIMFVRQSPPTLGHRRLKALAAYYPDLSIFINIQGVPSFIAETNKSGNRYIILYYPETRKAFAARCDTGNSHAIEFSGPHPITINELKMLNKLKSGAIPTSRSE